MKNPKCIENLRHMLRSLGNIKNQWKFRNLAKMFTKGQKLLKGIEILDKWRTKCFLIENNPKTSQICDILRNMLKNLKSIKNLQNMMQNPINCENRWKCQNLPMMLTKIWKINKNVVNLQIMWRFAASAKYCRKCKQILEMCKKSPKNHWKCCYIVEIYKIFKKRSRQASTI